MAAFTEILDLGRLGLKPGGGVRLDLLVPVGPFRFSDQDYVLTDDPVPVVLDVTRTSSGNVVRVRLETELNGPCMRCFADYALPLQIDHSEVHEPHVDEDLASEYVKGQDLDLAALVRDAIGLDLPPAIAGPVGPDGVCSECPGAAERLAQLREPEQEAGDGGGDPRWAKLRELEF